jgi:hypothetical protein
MTFREEIRRRVEYTIEPSVLAQAAMTIFDAQQYIAGVYEPTEDQLVALAAQLHVPIPSEVMARWRSRRGKAA